MGRIIKHRIIKEDGSIISIDAVAKLLRRKPIVIREWFLSGLTTLKELKKKDSTSVRHGATYKTCKGDLTLPQISEMSGLSRKVVKRKMAKRDPLCPSLFWPKMTAEEFRQKLIYEGLVKVHKAKKETLIKYEKTDTYVTFKVASAIVGVPLSTIYYYVNNHKCETIAQMQKIRNDFLERKKARAIVLERKKARAIVLRKEPIIKPKKAKPMTRTEMCFRYDCHGFADECCEHYGSCRDRLAFKGVRHSRYKKDGSCYTGVRLTADVQAGCPDRQLTDRIPAISY